MSTLGIYFGPHLINIAETQDKELLKHIQISRFLVSADKSAEEKVPEELKLITLIKEELEKNKIEADEAIVSLSGKDLIVRTFEMPILPRQELERAAIFEVKKYIPFKTEDLVSDFQWQLDSAIKKMRVLFVGIKKDALDKYLYILKEAGLKVKAIEYSAFSALRLLNLSGIREKGIIAVANIDLMKEDEASFVVLNNGFPLFSRDIVFAGYEEPDRVEELTHNAILEKLRREIQISLDYYDRKFSGKNIGKVFFITNPDYQPDLEAFAKDLGLNAQFIDVNKYVGRAQPFSLTFVKAYASSLSTINVGLKINLLLAKEKAAKRIGAIPAMPISLTAYLESKTAVITVSVFISLATFLFGAYRILPLRRELKNIINMRPAVSIASTQATNEELVRIGAGYKKKIEALNDLTRKKLYLTPLLDAIPRVLPEGMWLENLSLKKEEDRTDLILEGVAYLGDKGREAQLVNSFLSRLKEDEAFSQSFKEIALTLTEYKQLPEQEVGKTSFVISCKDLSKRQPGK